jgi:xanthine dehydrogenase/oxidase
LSIAVLDRALFHSDGTYHVPNFRVTGRIAKTNQPSNTAFRGFGAPQGMFMMEVIMDHVQRAVAADAVKVREQQFYVERDRTHFGQTLEACNVEKVWSQLKSEFQVDKKRTEIAAFNKTNRWRKRGLALVPTKFGISFTAKFMNQGGALVHVYADGSVLVSHGGTEMGQALHTKMLQVAAHELGVTMADVHIAETATNTVRSFSSSSELSSDGRVDRI